MEHTPNIAIFCDYENVAIGANDSGLAPFDVTLVLERLLERGNIVVKRAYADWGRLRNDRRQLHAAGFELVEIPHISLTGKNSADIRMVVDALDLCYTKDHIDEFALVSGDSDFSPLAYKLRENAKRVTGIGVKGSSGTLLIESCDEFLYYDELVRAARTRAGGDDGDDGLHRVVTTADSLLRERDGAVWGSMVKQAIKRKAPGFSEGNYGYHNFNHLLEDAARHDLLTIEKDDRSGGYLIRDARPPMTDQ